MNNIFFIIIILFNIILCIIITIIILSLFQQKKINFFKQKKNKLQIMIKNNKKFLNINLIKIKINFKMLKNENCYYKSKIIVYEITKQKELKKNNYFLIEKMTNKYYIEYLSGYLNIISSNRNKKINGIIYITNYRLIFKTKSKNILILLKNINFISPSIFNLNGFYQIGFFVSTEKKIYRFITNDIKISMIIFNKLKNKIKNI